MYTPNLISPNLSPVSLDQKSYFQPVTPQLSPATSQLTPSYSPISPVAPPISPQVSARSIEEARLLLSGKMIPGLSVPQVSQVSQAQPLQQLPQAQPLPFQQVQPQLLQPLQQVQQKQFIQVSEVETPQETLRKGKGQLPPYLISKLETNIEHLGDPRGSFTRGWSARAPQRGAERRELHERCGDSAFLLPEQNKFPIVQACRQQPCTCNYDCGGIQAAKIRAAQWGYTDIKQNADNLLNTYCKK